MARLVNKLSARSVATLKSQTVMAMAEGCISPSPPMDPGGAGSFCSAGKLQAQGGAAYFRRFFERKVINWLGDWFRRQGHQWSAAWVRENYLAMYREHLQMLVHVPRRLRGKLTRARARRWPEPEVVDLRLVYDEDAVSYIIKQHASQARFALWYRVHQERFCRHDQAPVAPVLGSRMSMTRDLERLVRQWELEAGGCHAR